jgi:uracil-DNA glycosylase family 4
MTPCSECPGFQPIPACGPTPCPWLFIGAGGGKSEARLREPYVGLAGDELTNTYLPIAGLRREDVAIGNATLCWDGTDRTPSTARVLACARHHLPRLLDRQKPEVVVLMGGVTKALCDLPLRLETHQGRPHWGTLLGGVWEGWIWPSYEPALGMRETTRMTPLLECFRDLGRWVRGEWAPPQPVEVEKDYQVITDPHELEEYLGMSCGVPTFPLAIDTEKDGLKPWSVQFSHTPHTGRLIRADDMSLLEELNWWLNEHGVKVILHFAGQDLDTLEKMGVRPPRFEYIGNDTGQEAYQLCSLPQGLKPIVYRLFGVTMRSWEDVVWPASVAAACDWMQRAADAAAGELQIGATQQLVMGVCDNCGRRGKSTTCKHCGDFVRFAKTTYRAGAAESILRHVRSHTLAAADREKPYDPWDNLAAMKVDGLRGKVAEAWEWEWLAERVGTTLPILGIGNCDEAEAVEYAIGDADMTGRVAAELERLRGGKRWRIADEDRDV